MLVGGTAIRSYLSQGREGGVFLASGISLDCIVIVDCLVISLDGAVGVTELCSSWGAHLFCLPYHAALSVYY